MVALCVSQSAICQDAFATTKNSVFKITENEVFDFLRVKWPLLVLRSIDQINLMYLYIIPFYIKCQELNALTPDFYAL